MVEPEDGSAEPESADYESACDDVLGGAWWDDTSGVDR